jgi:hypothetical protein
MQKDAGRKGYKSSGAFLDPLQHNRLLCPANTPFAIAFGIIQVGDDWDVREFLDTLAQDPALKDRLSVSTRGELVHTLNREKPAVYKIFPAAARDLENEFRKNKGRRAATTSSLVSHTLSMH